MISVFIVFDDFPRRANYFDFMQIYESNLRDFKAKHVVKIVGKFTFNEKVSDLKVSDLNSNFRKFEKLSIQIWKNLNQKVPTHKTFHHFQAGESKMVSGTGSCRTAGDQASVWAATSKWCEEQTIAILRETFGPATFRIEILGTKFRIRKTKVVSFLINLI